jgi:hypothetical protein
MNPVTVTLGDMHARKLRRLAEHAHTDEATLAGFLIASALDEAHPDLRDEDGREELPIAPELLDDLLPPSD